MAPCIQAADQVFVSSACCLWACIRRAGPRCRRSGCATAPPTTRPREIWCASVGLIGPRPDRLRQVDVGSRVARHRLRHARQRPHQIFLVDGGEQRVGGRGEFAHHQSTAGPGDPGHLAQPGRGSATLRSPKLMVTASNTPSPNGSRVASPATFGTLRACARRRASRPKNRPPRTTPRTCSAPPWIPRCPPPESSTLSPDRSAAPTGWPAANTGPGPATARCWSGHTGGRRRRTWTLRPGGSCPERRDSRPHTLPCPVAQYCRYLRWTCSWRTVICALRSSGETVRVVAGRCWHTSASRTWLTVVFGISAGGDE